MAVHNAVADFQTGTTTYIYNGPAVILDGY
jgi:hypothetical protein